MRPHTIHVYSHLTNGYALQHLTLMSCLLHHRVSPSHHRITAVGLKRPVPKNHEQNYTNNNASARISCTGSAPEATQEIAEVTIRQATKVHFTGDIHIRSWLDVQIVLLRSQLHLSIEDVQRSYLPLQVAEVDDLAPHRRLDGRLR